MARKQSGSVNMVEIAVTQRDVKRFYFLIVGLDLLFILATLLLDLGVRFHPLIDRQLNLEGEVNLATWYSSVLLFMAALVPAANSRIPPRGETPGK